MTVTVKKEYLIMVPIVFGLAMGDILGISIDILIRGTNDLTLQAFVYAVGLGGVAIAIGGTLISVACFLQPQFKNTDVNLMAVDE